MQTLSLAVYFNVLISYDSNTKFYVNELNLLEALFNHYSSDGDVLNGGDFNANCKDNDHHCCKSKTRRYIIIRSLGCPDIYFKTTGLIRYALHLF